jgi:hypothetical protein
MMSDQNHTGSNAIRPQVIDLDAEDITIEPDTPRPDAGTGDSQEPAGQPAERAQGGRWTALWLLGALILGLIGGGWLYRDALSGYLPSSEMTAMKARLDALEANGSGLAGEIATLKQATGGAAAAAGEAARSAGDALAEAKSASAGLSGLTDLGTRLDAMDARIAGAETALKTADADLASVRNALSQAAAASAGSAAPADTAALAALGLRIDALEKDMASLKSATAQATGGGTASVTSALSQALSDLKAKVAAGTGYGEEHGRIARMVPAAAGLQTVGARAAEGLPNAAGLTEELRAAIPALPQPQAPAAQDNSYLGSLMDSLSSIMDIRVIGDTDWPGVAGQALSFAEAGDLNQAIAVIDAAEGDKPMALVQWRDRAAARLQLEAALAEVSDAVLRQIAALGGAQQ